MRPVLLACLIFLLIIPSLLRADTWRDPSIKEMMDQSDVIGVFRVVEGGAFKARLVPVSIYKGRVSGEIWIGGFSNKYGPIDTLEVGQSYVLFINKVRKHKSRYGSSSNAGNQAIAQASYEASLFVRSQKNGYFVPTPTSGEYRVAEDRVFIDLPEVNHKIEGFPLRDLKRLVDYQFKKKDKSLVDYCKGEAIKNLQTANVYLLTSYLAALELIAPVSYDALFSKIASDTAWQVRFTLTRLLGKVKGTESRDLLVRMLGDSVGVVQGEAIRQLSKNESPSYLGPILLKFLDSASNQGLYPSLMSPVRNTRESGKIQIIETLAEMNYKEAIPSLTSLLKTEDHYVFKKNLSALQKLGAKHLAEPLIERLQDPKVSAFILFEITRIIEEQELTESKDALLAQLATHDRNHNNDKTILLSTLVVLAELDSSVENAIINDFKNFFTYYDTLQSSNQEKWIGAYLEACARLKSEAARPLVYQAVYEWTGFNPEQFSTVDAFAKQREIEDSIKVAFLEKMGSQGYTMSGVVHFPAIGSQPKEFIVSIITPDGNASFTFERRKLLADIIGIDEDNVFLKASPSWCWLDCQERFDTNGFAAPMSKFISYAEACPNETDLRFLKALMASGRWEAKYFDRELARAVLQIEAALSSRKN